MGFFANSKTNKRRKRVKHSSQNYLHHKPEISLVSIFIKYEEISKLNEPIYFMEEK